MSASPPLDASPSGAAAGAPRRSGLALRSVQLLQGLDDASLTDLAAQCRWQQLDARQTLFTRASCSTDVYFVISGRVRVASYAAQGREVNLHDFGPGMHFGTIEALDGQPRVADGTTLESALLASLTAAQFVALVRREPLVAQQMVLFLTQAVRVLAQRVVELSTLAVHARLHSELLRLAQEAGVQGNQARLAPTPLHAELAGRIGTNREQVTRELSALTRSGLLRKDGRKAWVLTDVAALQALVLQDGARSQR